MRGDQAHEAPVPVHDRNARLPAPHHAPGGDLLVRAGRDHRRVGKDIGLFTFHPWAPGATFWLGKGATFYNTLANYMREVLFPAGGR